MINDLKMIEASLEKTKTALDSIKISWANLMNNSPLSMNHLAMIFFIREQPLTNLNQISLYPHITMIDLDM